MRPPELFYRVRRARSLYILEGERGSILHHVIARVSEDYQLELHLDTDEANASGARNGDTATIIM